MKLFNRGEPCFLNKSLEKKPQPINYQLLAPWELRQDDLENHAISKLHGSAYFKMLDEVKRGIAANIPLDAVNNQGFTVLTGAAKGGALEVVIFLLELGMNPAYAPKATMAYNAYHAACAGGHMAIIEYLLKNYSNKINLDMEEPLFRQTGLQIAIINNQFILATQLIDEKKANHQHVDKRGRTPLATALGCFIRAGFDSIADNAEQKANLQNICLKLLASENAFVKANAKAKPAILVVETCELAMNLPSGSVLERRMSPEHILLTIMVVCPKVADELLRQAKLNPEGDLEKAFIKNYKDRVLYDLSPDLDKNKQTTS